MNYAIMVRDGVEVHPILDEPPLSAATWTKAGTGYLYLKVHDIERVYREVWSRGIEIENDLETASWGAKGFEIRDCSGNLIRIEEEM